MRKSYNTAIFLSDRDKEISSKISQMITDPQRMRKSDPGDPKICNVFTFHEIYTPEGTVAQIEKDCSIAAIGCVECKKIMAKNLTEALAPVREKRKALESDPDLVKGIIEKGNNHAREIARMTMTQVREAIHI
jgi:tryptophanyl-tRNA synthetase